MLEFGGHPISVAVRVSPLNPQEKTERGSQTIIGVDDATTVSVTNLEDPREIRVFGFPHVYWSCDGFVELQDGLILPDLKHPNGFKHSDNRRIFEDFGKEMVQNAWSGMNNTFLCFGDLASGKSWTLFGNPNNKGLIHLFASELFKTLREREKTSSVSNASPIGSSVVSEVRLSIGEIHENLIKDLLQPLQSQVQSNGGSTKYKIGVKVREHPKRGFYVEGLRSLIVTSSDDVQSRLEEAQNTRAAIAISRGLLCSPAVVIVSLSLVQKCRNPKGDEMTMSSVTEFYDVPTRRPQTSPTMESSQENSNSTNYKNYFNSYTPNKKFSNNEKLSRSVALPAGLEKLQFDEHFASFVTALANNSTIPFDTFTLSKLLEKGLSGNSKTYCIAHITPSQAKRDASLWTLTLADKLVKLRTHPTTNEEVTSRLIRELKLENDSLKKMLTSGGLGEGEKNECFAWSDKLSLSPSPGSEEFRRQMIDDIRSQVKDNEREIKGLSLSQDERAKLARLDKPNDTSQSLKKLDNEKKHKPFIYNLSGDSQLNGRLVHVISSGSTEFGSGKERVIRIFGPGAKEFHGTFHFSGKDNKVTIRPANPECLIKLNGSLISSEAPLFHNDRILLGGSQFWIFQNPREPWLEKNPVMTKISLTQAQEELCIKSPFYASLSENGILDPSLKSSAIRIYSRVEDANAILNELEISASFEPVVIHDINRLLPDSFAWNISHSSGDLNTFDTEPAVRLHLLKEDARFVLSEETFRKKYEELKKGYAQCLEDNTGPPTDAIFADISETPVTIGHSLFSLKPLAYLIKYEDDLEVLDYVELKPVGTIKVSAAPCNEYFEELKEDQNFASESSELISKQLHFTLRIGSVSSLALKYKDITCTYKFFSETSTSTGKLDTKQASFPSSNPEYKYERRFSIEHVTPQLIESLEKDLVVLTFYGKLRSKSGKNQFRASNSTNYGSQNSSKKSPYLGWIQRQKAELLVAQKAGERVKTKLGVVQNLISCSDELSQSFIPLEYLKRVCNVKDQGMAMECLKEFKEEFAPPPEIEPVPKPSTYQKVSEVCAVM